MPLLKSKISKILMYSGENYFIGWLTARLGKFTASKIACCMGANGIGKEGMAYIRSRAFEFLNKVSSEKEIDTESMRWGLQYEPEALRAFIKYKNIPVDEQGRVPIIPQVIVAEEGSLFGVTPDGIWVKMQMEDGLHDVVETIESKCFQLARHLKCISCDTAAKIKSVDPDSFWQTIMQMDECGALVGWLVYFYPGLKYGSLRVIEFRKVNLIPEFKLLTERKKEIIRLYEIEKEAMMQLS